MRIFITGASTGIGMSLAKKYLSEGHYVGVCARDKNKFVSSYADVTSEDKQRLSFFEVNVENRDKIVSAINEFAQSGLDIIIANAGISMGTKSPIPSFDRAREVINVNVIGVLNTFEAALPFFIKQNFGQLVAIASLAGFAGFPGTAAYSASKSAVITLCETFSLDLMRFGITTTCICPGFVDTPLTQKNPHTMPFLIDLQMGTKLIKKAIDGKKEYYAFPWQMHFIAAFLRLLPRKCYRRLMRFFKFDFSKKKENIL